MKYKKQINPLIRCVFIALTFFIIDFSLRYLTRWLGYYSIFEFAPTFFSLCYIEAFVVLLSLLPRKVGRIVYVGAYAICAIYSLIQYIYYLIFDKFFFVTDIQYAGEGNDYLNYVIEVLNGNVLIMLVIFLIFGIAGFLVFPNFKDIGSKLTRNVLRISLLGCGCIGLFLIPSLYSENEEVPFLSSQYEYEQFSNAGFDMELTGLYQYVVRDVWKSHFMPKENSEELYCQVEDYLASKNSSECDNQMTGIFTGKNLILVQMESLDDWVINEQSAPTISRLMDEGINFSNMYTCLYGSGSTFSTEFAFNTGIYQSTKSAAAYSCSRNSFPFSLANMLGNMGYIANSFHENVASYYNRNNMHSAMGFEKYYSLLDYVDDPALAEYDSALVENDYCWDAMTGQEPFFSFLITYSAHVPYSSESALAQAALDKYPEYKELDISEEMQYLYAKVRLTDEMFAVLLERLEEDGLLDNTVIIAYTDHYCYGLNDKQLIHELSEENGSSILERTPAFIWYKDCDSMVVEKVCQTIDWVPTIANFYGLNVSSYVMGNDIFDDAYDGYAIFPDGTWLTEDVYVINGVVNWNEGMSDEEIKNMNSFVQKFYDANEAILTSDYYTQFED